MIGRFQVTPGADKGRAAPAGAGPRRSLSRALLGGSLFSLMLGAGSVALAQTAPSATAPAAPVLTIGKLALTGGQARALLMVVERIATGAAGVADAEVVADTIIAAALTSVGPVAALAAPAADFIANSIIEAIASGSIKITPGSGANADALHHGGRNP